MKKIAFIFKTVPHGTSSGREGLDVVLASSVPEGSIGIFFIGDGVFQILKNQKPTAVLARNYISTFKLLPLCGIQKIWICNRSLHERGLNKDTEFVLKPVVLDPDKLRKELEQYHSILTF